MESGGDRSLSVEAAAERGGEAEKAPRQPLPRRRPAPAASVPLAAPAPRPCRGLAGAEERRQPAVLRGLPGPSPALPHATRAGRRLSPRRAPGPLRRQHGGREDLQQRGSYRSPALPPGPARGSRAERGRGPQLPRVGRRRRRPWGRGTARAPPRAGQGEGRGGPGPEAAAPRSRVGSTEAWPAHPQPVALQGLRRARTSLCRSSPVIEEADTRVRGPGEDRWGGDPWSRYTYCLLLRFC